MSSSERLDRVSRCESRRAAARKVPIIDASPTSESSTGSTYRTLHGGSSPLDASGARAKEGKEKKKMAPFQNDVHVCSGAPLLPSRAQQSPGEPSFWQIAAFEVPGKVRPRRHPVAGIAPSGIGEGGRHTSTSRETPIGYRHRRHKSILNLLTLDTSDVIHPLARNVS